MEFTLAKISRDSPQSIVGQRHSALQCQPGFMDMEWRGLDFFLPFSVGE
ncbi:hypothetical protein AMD24_00644 [Candidatus Xiphinematobacter sp. Idaho Grape]|nr:hypothetical protein AMD24_00644 [Candidatus Xiphinematobacter sp. Idaho Grape]